MPEQDPSVASGNGIAPKVSKVEVIKREGNHLRGTIKEALADGTSHFQEENIQLLKFHGMYQQDDRDLRAQAKKEGREKYYSMMIRARMPGGVMSPEAYLQFDKISEQYGNQTMRITTRQTFQLHGILKGNVKEAIRGLNEALVTTLGGCGDQVRNTISCADPTDDVFHREIRQDLLKLVGQFGAKTNAYHEIWLDGEQVQLDALLGNDGASPASQVEEEPLYKDVYLPRKFKLGFTTEGHNCSDVYANDIGIVAHRASEGDGVEGYTLLVGGGMGRTPSNKETYPRLATPVTYVTRAELVDTCTEIVKIQRDFGNREDRRYARFKYLLDKNGLPWFEAELAARLSRPLTPPRKLVWHSAADHLGWHSHGDNKYYLGIFVENGRVKDWPELQLKTVLREIVSEYRPTVRLTTQQNILLCDLQEEDRTTIEAKLQQAGVKLLADVSTTVLNAMACPALPTCGLATAESERALPGVLQEFESLLAELALTQEVISVRMTGCSNGCARPYIADIGFVGRAPGKYDLFLAGDFMGARLNQLYREMMPIADFIPTIRPLLLSFKADRTEGERFGDYCYRVGLPYLHELEQVGLKV